MKPSESARSVLLRSCLLRVPLGMSADTHSSGISGPKCFALDSIRLTVLYSATNHLVF